MPRTITARTPLTVPAAVTALAHEREAARRPGEPGAVARALMASDATPEDRRAHVYAALVRAGVVGRFTPAPTTTRLTRFQLPVLTAFAAGLSTAEAAAVLSLSPETVKRHSFNIMRRLGVASRVEAIVEATRQGLLPALPAPRGRRPR